jgi:hypothetical protein
MKLQKNLLVAAVVLLLVPSSPVAASGDFAWIEDINVRAKADPSGFRTRLAARFKIGGERIDAILSNVDSAADAYMVFRLGEMSSMSPDYVLKRYLSEKGKGWGVVAKSLGIKPGSAEFHALKRGSDLYGDNKADSKGKDHDKRGGKTKGKGGGKK